MNTPEPLAYRLKDVARLLGLSSRTVWRLVKEKKIPCVYLGDGRKKTLLFPAETLRSWLREQAGQNQANG